MTGVEGLLRMPPGCVLLAIAWWIVAAVLIQFGVAPAPAAVIAALLVLGLLASRRRPAADSHGSARFADTCEIDAAGFTTGSGLVLGRDRARSALLWMPDWAVHYLCVAPTGAGKSVSVIAPTLLSYTAGALVVFDFKNGESFWAFAAARAALGRRVARLDIWGVGDGDGVLAAARFNPLDLLDPASATLVDDGLVLASAVVLRDPGEHQRFFNDMATIVLHFLILFVAVHGGEGERNWGSVVALAKNPAAFVEAVTASLTSAAAGGALAELAGSVSYLVGNRDGQRGSEFHSVLATLNTHLSSFESTVVKASFSETTLDLAGLRRGDTDIFLCMDASRLESHQAIPRLWVTAILRYLIAHPDGAKVLVIADEVAQLGRGVPLLEAAITLLRSYRVQLAVFVQALPQLAKIFPADQGQTALANFDVVQFFAVNDHATASAVSQRLGAATVHVSTGQDGGSSGTSGGFGQPSNANWSESWGTSIAPHERLLVRPEEAFLLGGKTLIFARGRRPVLAKLLRYFDDPAFSTTGKGGGLLWAWGLLAASMAVLALVWWQARVVPEPPTWHAP